MKRYAKKNKSISIIACMIIIVLLVLALTQCSVSYHIFNDKTIKLMDCDAELFGPLLGGQVEVLKIKSEKMF